MGCDKWSLSDASATADFLPFLEVKPPPALVAPYCAILRDYLSDNPLLRAMGFLVSQHGQLGAKPLPPFLSISPLESMQGYLTDTCAIPYENKANGCDTPLCDTISKGYCAIWGVSCTGPLSPQQLLRKAAFCRLLPLFVALCVTPRFVTPCFVAW